MRPALGWIVPGLLSIALNLVFFSLMPLMIDTNQRVLEKTVPAAMVSVVRITPAEPEPPPPRKEAPKPLDKPNKTKAPEQPATPSQDLPRTSTLSFEVNPRLPAAPGIPSLAMGSLNLAAPAFKPAYTADEIDSSLTPRVHVPPVYPFSAKRRGIQGWVKVRFLVTLQGTVDTIAIEDADPVGVFDSSVTAAVSQWRFSPGTVDGIPVNTWVTTTIRFELKD